MDKISKTIIQLALDEDEIRNDITTKAVFGDKGGLKEGVLLAKEDLVFSGIHVAQEIYSQVSPKIRIRFNKKDGAWVLKGETIAVVKGPVSDLLRAERVVLNFLQHLSGVATLTRRFVEAIKPYRTKIMDTRKTLPGLRALEKMAVIHGGGYNHRMNLSDQYLIKDNHVEAAGGLEVAIDRVKEHQKNQNKKLRMEAEARNLREVRTALKMGVDILLLDNMRLSQIRCAVILAKGKCLLEVSGGVNLRNVRKIAQTGVARISIGQLTHSVKAVDLSFEMEN